MSVRRRVVTFLSLFTLLTGVVVSIAPVTAVADHTADPVSVAIAGNLQDEVGCPGDWQPDCAATELVFDAEDGVWQGVFAIPAGSWEYKAPLNDSWDENYGTGAIFDGPNIGLALGASTDVKFYYDHESHWVTDDVNSVIATVAGSFQSALGCSGDWQPWCLQSWMQDSDGDGVYEFSTDAIPGGSYEFKVALDEGWATSFPGGNVAFTSATGDSVAFTYDAFTDDVAVTVTPSGPVAVTIVGSLQDELGCVGDWQSDCVATHLSFDAADDVWQGAFAIPAGSWEYKAAIDDSWDENYGANAAFNGPNIGLVLAAATDVKFYYGHKSHWVTDDVNSVIATAVGSFQSELGCPGDWQPACLRSWLQDPDGDGVYEFVTDEIPAGPYEFKVALDETWDTSYPGANVAFTAPGGTTITFSYDAGTNDVSVDIGGGTAEPGDDLLVQPPVRVDAQDNVFYFVMPDRFENGDPGNDAGGDLSGDPLINGFLATDKGYYHGGDLTGLAARLPYLDALGVTAVWLTPQFTNRWVQGDGTLGGSSAAYHGYWQIDYSSIDPHFGSNAEMQGFVSSAHALGIDVYFDIVANHTGDVIAYVEGDTPPYVSKADAPYLNASGVPFDDADFAGTGTFPALDPNVSFPYTPTFAASGDETVKFPDFLDDPTLYHNRGDSTFSGESSLYGDFVGLDDLWTEHPTVQDGLIQLFKDMVTDFDVDGFRIDTVKHVNDEFWEAFGPELTAHAASLGKTDFFMFGEIFNFDVQALSRFSTELPLDAVLDFAFQGTARNFASQSGATDSLADFYAADDYYTDTDSNAYSLPLFLGNHDMGRIGLFLNQDNPSASDAELVARDELAHALMYFGRGIPVLYYGDEQGFVGDGGDQDARQDMMPSIVATYNNDDLIGTPATTADANFDDTHPLYQTLSDFSALLSAHPALTRGAQLHRYSQGSAGIYAFSRIERTEQVEYVVALNNSEAPDSAVFDTDSPGTSFTEIWPGGGPSITADAAGNLTVDVPALGVKLYRADSNIASPTTAPVVTMTAPTTGEEVLGRVEVGASLSSSAYAEVTFAVSIDATPFEPIGTDDNAPYRVFYDVSGLAGGTSIEFKAIADNKSGTISSDKVAAVIGTEEPPSAGGLDYAIVHYNRPAGDYGDHTTGDFTDFWGLHLWGDAIDPSEVTAWPDPKPFLGEDEFGRFAWMRRGGTDSQVNLIIHQGNSKDTPDDRSFDADTNPEIWINQGDATIYTSQADAQGFVTVHYHRDDGDYGTPSPDFNTFWGLHLWGDAIDASEGTVWANPKAFDGVDDYGAYWNIQIADSTQPVNFIIHRGDTKDPGPDESFVPTETPTVWKQSGDEEIYPSRGAAENIATIHYHRDDGDYGDNSSPDSNDFWGMHVWSGALNPNPSWTEPVRWVGLDVFGPVFEVDLIDGASGLAYIIHRGDQKDPGPDQFLALGTWGHEVWQLSGESPSDPTEPHYALPVRGEAPAPNRTPVADANGPYTGLEGSPLSLDGTGSTDPDTSTGDSIVMYEWDLDNDGEFDDATGAVVSQAFGDNGVYPVGLRVTDSFGESDTDVTTATVSNVAPSVGEPTVVPEPSVEGDAVTVSATFTDPGFDDTPFSCTVEYGDGSPVQTGTVNDDTCTGPSHVYADDGTYTVEATVTDKDGDEGSAATSHVVGNTPPGVIVDIASQTVQYSDHIAAVTVTATDVPADPLQISTSWSVDGGASSAGLPDALSVADEGCTVNSIRTCEWSLTGQVTEAEGIYVVAVTVADDNGGAATVETVIAVLPEDATVEFDSGNPVAVEVATSGGNSGPFSLTVVATEAVPDSANGVASFGNIANAVVAVTLAPIGPGPPSVGTCIPNPVTGSGYDAVLTVTCNFDAVPVNTYTVEAVVDSGYYDGYNEDILVVYDPSLGFTTGGGWFYWPDTDDKTTFGYTMKYNKKGTKIKGSFLLIRHLDDGSKYRVKSNALYGLALGEADEFGWASFSGKATYLEPGWPEAIGNHEFVVYVEDHGPPGDGDRIWLEMHDKARDVIPALSMDRDAADNATHIDGGNMVVHH